MSEQREEQDEELVCAEKDCGAKFIHSVGEQRWMRGKFGDDYSKPKRCPDCRKRKKAERKNDNK